MAQLFSLFKGAGMGAGLMYFFDPKLGRRRRSLVRDHLIHRTCQARKAADVVRRDAGNRLHGIAAELRGALRPDEPADEVLEARVRSRIGRCVSHPSAIEASARDGAVILSGPVLAEEVQNLLSNVRQVRGVQRVVNELEVHQTPDSVSALQGDQPLDVTQQNWSPTTRTALGLAGLALMASGVGRGSVMNRLLGAFGFGLMASVALCGQGNSTRQCGMHSGRGRRHDGALAEQGQPQETSGSARSQDSQEPKIERASSPAQAGEPAVYDL